MSDFEVMAALRRKEKMKKPTSCPDSVYSIMAACWAANPLERATAVKIAESLENLGGLNTKGEALSPVTATKSAQPAESTSQNRANFRLKLYQNIYNDDEETRL